MTPTNKLRLKEVPFTNNYPLLSIPMEISGDSFKPTRFFKLQQFWDNPNDYNWAKEKDHKYNEWRDIPIVGLDEK